MTCVFEKRLISGMKFELHANWLTDSKRKRAITIDRFLDLEKENWITFTRPEESDGYFAFTRRGKMNYMGEYNNMHIFGSVLCQPG